MILQSHNKHLPQSTSYSTHVLSARQKNINVRRLFLLGIFKTKGSKNTGVSKRALRLSKLI
jgi:hypothetical protein